MSFGTGQLAVPRPKNRIDGNARVSIDFDH